MNGKEFDKDKFKDCFNFRFCKDLFHAMGTNLMEKVENFKEF